jgi:protein involved in polysaccharide export with SLBB domain
LKYKEDFQLNTRKFVTHLLPVLLPCTGFVLSACVFAQSGAVQPSLDQSEAAQPPQYGPVPDAAVTAPSIESTVGPASASQPDEAQPAAIPEQKAAAKSLAINPDKTTSSKTELRPSAILPLNAKSEFELFVADAAGQPLPVYGRQLFNEVPTTFSPVERIPVPSDYALGAGDQLIIRVWGRVDLESKVTVDRNGQIFIPRIGTFRVMGLRYEQIEGYLRSEIGKLYKGFELNVTMGQLRSIQILVLGSARQPGAYTVSSLSTLVNALFASGGPSTTGSMRKIQLRRDNKVVTEFDIYDLLRKGDKSHDVQLLSGDVIYIPSVGPQVALFGSVNEPGIYEIKDETTIAEALKSAGGITNLAEVDRVLLERIENRRRRRVDEFALDATGAQRVLHDGDMLELFPISLRFENAVTLRGNVEKPGRFSWREGLRVADLIPTRDFLITRGYWRQQNHRAGNIPVDMMTDLSQNSAEINWDYAAISRLDDHDLSTHVIALNLGKAIDDPASPENQALRPGDVVTIFARKDLPLPQDKHAAFVRVSGEVNVPGVYRIQPGETLRRVVEQAGGLTEHSYLYASQLNRASTRIAEEQQLRISTSQMQRELLSGYASASTLTTKTATEQQAQLGSQQALIAQLSSIHPTGRIVLNLKPDSKAIADVPDFPLEDGDSFYVPPQLGTIQVSGAVYNENAFRYQPRKHLSAYLKDAGGPNRQADVKRIYLIRADGTVVPKQGHRLLWRGNYGDVILLPGDAIVVPTKLKSFGGFSQQWPYITQTLSQTAMTGAVIGMAY